MSEMKVNNANIIRKGKQNPMVRSWVSAVIGLWMVLAGMTVYSELVPLFGILGILLGVYAYREGRKVSGFSGKYMGVLMAVLGIMECISCFKL